MANLAELEAKIAAQGSKIRDMKAAKADAASIKAEVDNLIKLKAEFTAAGGVLPEPVKQDKKKKAEKAPKAEVPADAKKAKQDAKEARKAAFADKQFAAAPKKDQKGAKKEGGGAGKAPAAPIAPGTLIFPKAVTEAVRLKVLVVALAAHASPPMADGEQKGEPSLSTDKEPITGVSAICRHLASEEQGRPLLPPKHLKDIDTWLAFDEATLAPALAKRPAADVAIKALEALEKQLAKNGGKAVVGDSLTLADVVLWSTVYSGIGAQDDLSAEVKAACPELTKWLHSCPASCSALSLMLSVTVAPRAAPKKKKSGFRFGDTFYITTAINYANGQPHMGHAYEAILTDVQARYHRAYGREVFFLTGTDEHGQKIADASVAKGYKNGPLEMIDMYVDNHFKPLNTQLSISNDRYVRTTEAQHKKTAQKIWELAEANGDIYKDMFEGWYNVKEEAYVTDTDAMEADYKDDAGNPLQKRKEESYFFKMSRYHKWLVEHFKAHPEFLQPTSRYNEIMKRLEGDELRDLSSSRNTFDWGVPILTKDGQPTGHVMYVWFDALTNYLTGIDYYPGNHGTNSKFWPAQCHVIGKDIIWFHTVIWPCMLKSAGIPLPRTVFAHGFVKGEDGLKMSKSIGNVVDPVEMMKTYSSDTFRYFVCRECSFGADLTWSTTSMEDRHNSELADMLGNLVHRATNLVGKYDDAKVAACEADHIFDIAELIEETEEAFVEYRVQDASELAADAVRATNKYITDMEPWKMKDDPVGRTRVVKSTLEAVYVLAHFMAPYIPDAVAKIFERLGTKPRPIKELSPKFNNLAVGTEIKVGEVLFVKFEKEGDKKGKK